MNEPDKTPKQIFDRALEITSPEERQAYLDQVGRDDPELKRRVEMLLAAYEQAASFLESPPADLQATQDASPISEGPGSVIGRYKLLQEIGHGGMGTVFMAQQTEGVDRQVALKIINPGMDSRAVIARFEQERQALAMMDHPNIAKVLDAGSTENGRPYFVMELVRGVPMTRYCDEHQLTPRERLKLFQSVCQAVQHAHQKGVIHRDLKPSNVLVANYDDQPVVKVIDFGVAKAIGRRLTEKTLFTQFGQIVGTLEYMSPEQARFNQLDIDTRSDIYALGVLLYELLTGETPFDRDRMKTAAFDEVLRIIREEEPPKPSTRVSAAKSRSAVTGERCSTEPRRLFSMLRGDLDWLVMKALSKERNRRYETASGLAADIGRYLNGDAIEARPPSTVYRLRKTAARHRVAIVSTAVVLLALLIGLGTAIWQRQSAIHHLHQCQNLIIELALQQAFGNEQGKFTESMKLAEKSRVPDDWLKTLEACAAIHRGAPKEARDLLERAIEANSDNVSAHALLAIAHMWSGDREAWSEVIDEVLEMNPRPEYEEFDALFLAYAQFYVDYREAAEQFSDVLAENDTWFVPRVLMASAYGHAAATHESPKFARQGLAELAVPEVVVGNCPVVTLTRMGVYLPALVLLGDEQPELREKADEIARQLGEDPDNAIFSHMRALYYQAVGETGNQEQAARDVLRTGSGFLLEYSMAMMFGLGHTQEVLAVPLDDLIEPRISRAYVFAMSPSQADRKKALEEFESLRKTHKSWYARYKMIQIPLLCGELKLAKNVCEKWSRDEDGTGYLGQWERQSIDFIKSGGNDDAFRADSSDAPATFAVNYQRGLVALARDDRTTAIEYLDAASAWKFPDERRLWAQAFLTHLSGETEQPEAFKRTPQRESEE